jgi:hypothetical protein
MIMHDGDFVVVYSESGGARLLTRLLIHHESRQSVHGLGVDIPRGGALFDK